MTNDEKKQAVERTLGAPPGSVEHYLLTRQGPLKVRILFWTVSHFRKILGGVLIYCTGSTCMMLLGFPNALGITALAFLLVGMLALGFHLMMGD
jgi:hypothetical protein